MPGIDFAALRDQVSIEAQITELTSRLLAVEEERDRLEKLLLQRHDELIQIMSEE